MGSGFESCFPMLWVVIALLSGLGCSKSFLNILDLPFSLKHQVRTKDATISCLGPVQRFAALPSVQCLKRRHLETCLIAVVVRKFRIWQTILPFGSMGEST